MIPMRRRRVFLIRPPVVAVDVFPKTEVALVDNSERLVLSVAEAAELLGISKSLAYDLVARGELPARRFGGRIVVLWRPLDRLLAGEPAEEEAAGSTSGLSGLSAVPDPPARAS